MLTFGSGLYWRGSIGDQIICDSVNSKRQIMIKLSTQLRSPAQFAGFGACLALIIQPHMKYTYIYWCNILKYIYIFTYATYWSVTIFIYFIVIFRVWKVPWNYLNCCLSVFSVSNLSKKCCNLATERFSSALHLQRCVDRYFLYWIPVFFLSSFSSIH